MSSNVCFYPFLTARSGALPPQIHSNLICLSCALSFCLVSRVHVPLDILPRLYSAVFKRLRKRVNTRLHARFQIRLFPHLDQALLCTHRFRRILCYSSRHGKDGLFRRVETRVDVVDQSPARCRLCVDDISGQEKFPCLLPSDDVGQQARLHDRGDAERDLGHRERRGGVGVAEVARRCHFQARAKAAPRDVCDRGDVHGPEGLTRIVHLRDERPRFVGGAEFRQGSQILGTGSTIDTTGRMDGLNIRKGTRRRFL